MTVADQMLATHPKVGFAAAQDALLRCIEACAECAQACTACADACLGEDMVAELVTCIRKNSDCADICAATGAVLSRQTAPDVATVRALLEACRTACASSRALYWRALSRIPDACGEKASGSSRVEAAA